MGEELALVVRWIGNDRNGTVCCVPLGCATEYVEQLNKANTHNMMEYHVEKLLDEKVAMKDEFNQLENYKKRQSE